MDRDRKANTRCTWFTQIGYVHGIEEFSLIVKGLHKYIGSSSPLVSTGRCGIFSGSTLPPSRGGIFNWWRCTRLGQARYKPCSRSPPSRRARGSAERGDRQEYKAD
ncbi:hypothetical protein ACFX2H_045761 [Malus domestica]